jgi:hypothetical protein
VGAILEKLRSIFLAQQKYVAFLLLALIAVAGVLDNQKLQLSATVAMLALILNLLFTIDERVASSVDSMWYATFSESLPAIKAEIDRRLAKGRPVRMRWIGVTQEAGWPFAQNLLLDTFDHSARNGAILHVELAMLDPDGTVCQRPNGPDRDQIRSTAAKIVRFLSSQAARMGGRGGSLSVYFYDHRPTWHALLLDDDRLYYSSSLPQNLVFSSPQSGVEVVAAEAGQACSERIRHFVAWFDHIKAESDLTGKSLVLPKP